MELTREYFLASSLEKVLPNSRPAQLGDNCRLYSWPGAKASVQLVYSLWGQNPPEMLMKIFSVDVSCEEIPSDIYNVKLLNVENTTQPGADDFFISKEAGLYPDPLTPLREEYIRFVPQQYRSLWITWRIPTTTKPGKYIAHIRIKDNAGTIEPSGMITPAVEGEYQIIDLPVEICVGSSVLPEQKVFHKELFHADCLCDYYHVDAWSEKHWEICENFLAAAQEHQINEIMAPLFTPCFDTAPIYDRTTVQLVDVYVNDGKYSFNFDKVDRWIDLCHKYGVKRFNIPPLFTQWGAVATPKIEAVVDGKKERIFGWHVSAKSKEYRKFLEAFIPALLDRLEKGGYGKGSVVFRISDEPSPEHYEGFINARKQLLDLVEGYTVIDSSSSIDFYKEGICPYPEVQMNLSYIFKDAGVPNYYVYYCVAQITDVPNRFVAMPSSRNRALGVTLYMEDVSGFGHWGYNFYSTQYSKAHIDPFHPEYGEYCFPAGDAYLVYPGDDNKAWPSIRVEVQDEAFYDYRALQLLESLKGRDYVKKVVLETAGMKDITFLSYPRTADFYKKLRETIFTEIEEALATVER